MNLTPLELTDFEKFSPYFQDQPYRLCAYSLPAILAWRSDDYTPVGGIADGAFLAGARFHHEPAKDHLLLPVGLEEGLSPKGLNRLAETAGFPEVQYVPDCYMGTWGRDAVEAIFDVTEETGEADYIYRAEDLALLKGNRYSKKRNLIHQFERRYIATGRAVTEPITLTNHEACIDFLEEWCRFMACGEDPGESLLCEKHAIINTLRHIDRIGMRGLLVRVDGMVSGFGVGTMLRPDMGVLHFEKAFPSIKGLYQYLDRSCARDLFPDAVFINKEGDMDLPGLARAKRSYHPVGHVRAYRLKCR